MVGIGHSYNMNCLYISMILKNKDSIKETREVCYTDDVKEWLKKCGKEMDGEPLRMRMQDVSISLMLAQEKTKSLYENLKRNI